MKKMLFALIALSSLSAFADCSVTVPENLPGSVAAVLREKQYVPTFRKSNIILSYRLSGWYPNRQVQEGTEAFLKMNRIVEAAPAVVLADIYVKKGGPVYDLSLFRERTAKTDRVALKRLVKKLSKIEPCDESL